MQKNLYLVFLRVINKTTKIPCTCFLMWLIHQLEMNSKIAFTNPQVALVLTNSLSAFKLTSRKQPSR
jgi:hypothetical protein